MQQPYGNGPRPPMQLQTVKRSYRSAKGYQRDAARMLAHGFTQTRQDANGVTWERLIPWGMSAHVPPQVRELPTEFWIVIGVFGTLLLLMLILIAATDAGTFTGGETDTVAPATVAVPAAQNRATATATAAARAVNATPTAGIVPRPIVLPGNGALATPTDTAGPAVTPIPFASPGAPLPTAPAAPAVPIPTRVPAPPIAPPAPAMSPDTPNPATSTVPSAQIVPTLTPIPPLPTTTAPTAPPTESATAPATATRNPATMTALARVPQHG